MGSTELVFGFECSGNRRPLQGLRATAAGRACRSATVLDRAGVKAEAREFVFFGADQGEEDVEFRGTVTQGGSAVRPKPVAREGALGRADARVRAQRRAAHEAPGISAAPARAGLVRRRQRQVLVRDPRPGRSVRRQVAGALVPHAARRDDQRRDEVDRERHHAHAVRSRSSRA